MWGVQPHKIASIQLNRFCTKSLISGEAHFPIIDQFFSYEIYPFYSLFTCPVFGEYFSPPASAEFLEKYYQTA